jgi:hypothetical protein
MLLGVVGTLVLAGCGTGASDTADGGGSTSFPIPTSDWRPSDHFALEAAISGTLQLDENECLVVGDIPVLWPADFTASTDSDGVVHIFDPEGHEVASTGSRVPTTGGGYDLPKRHAPCPGDYDTYFTVMDDMSDSGSR